ncbi:MAG: L-fuculose kinase [Woeseiaceae bacterium]|nr:L-fuculose kinase [Woeseiaceae bacterium]
MLESAPYPHADVDGIWQWMMEVFRACAAAYEIGAIAVSAHGATAALVDSSRPGDGLVLPIMDYEWRGVESLDESYQQLRPSFNETYSPSLPGGLNIGRQLVWQQHHYQIEFESADALLMYPQYWSWRLAGKLVSEVSSLGCHTDLWSPTTQGFSSLVSGQSWTDLMPPLMSAWESVGTLSEAVATESGLPGSCRVHVGVHDSNASLLRFLLAKPSEDFCVVSSGTWVVCMSTGDSLHCLNQTKDMLANVDVNGNPVPCVRFMGGREYAEICAVTGSANDRQSTEEDIAQIIRNGVVALPNFSSGSGPFGDRKPEIRGTPHNGAALATLYCALMVDHCLDLLQVDGDVIVVGSYLQNPLLCSLIAQLRVGQSVYVASDEAGTVRGAAQLTTWSTPVSLGSKLCVSSEIADLENYCASWHEQIGGIS